MVPIQICIFGADLKSKMAVRGQKGFKFAYFQKSFLSETTRPIELKLCSNVPWIVIYLICIFRGDRKSKMAATPKLSLT